MHRPPPTLTRRRHDRTIDVRRVLLRAHAQVVMRLARLDGERGSAAVEYVGLALVVSAMMAAIGGAVDSALGDRMAHAIVRHLLDRVGK